ncbi:hypothetical protein [Brevibacterium ravenspurgense]|uniref:hypothetical protein n=1 Tax=Brevibacterium ravenspurgense TaxID=479117 RepID=UPI0002F7B5A3|nr:hypothetical protein [Brevibacterium ravenspurgense]
MTRQLFTGLSAFPLTPLHNDCVDEQAFTDLIERLAASEGRAPWNRVDQDPRRSY